MSVLPLTYSSGVLLAKAADPNHFTLYVALITGGSALLGAAVGGLISGAFSLEGEKKRQQFAREEATRRDDREDRREDAAAQGAARVMASEFKRALSILIAAKLARAVFPEHSINVSEVADRKLVAPRLDAAQWHRVVVGEQVLRAMVEHRATLAARFQGHGFDGEVERFMDQGIDVIEKAIAALRPLTGGNVNEAAAPLVPAA